MLDRGSRPRKCTGVFPKNMRYHSRRFGACSEVLEADGAFVARDNVTGDQLKRPSLQIRIRTLFS